MDFELKPTDTATDIYKRVENMNSAWRGWVIFAFLVGFTAGYFCFR